MPPKAKASVKSKGKLPRKFSSSSDSSSSDSSSSSSDSDSDSDSEDETSRKSVKKTLNGAQYEKAKQKVNDVLPDKLMTTGGSCRRDNFRGVRSTFIGNLLAFTLFPNMPCDSFLVLPSCFAPPRMRKHAPSIHWSYRPSLLLRDHVSLPWHNTSQNSLSYYLGFRPVRFWNDTQPRVQTILHLRVTFLPRIHLPFRSANHG